VFVWAWLNLGELPRLDNQLPHLAALSLHLVDLARAALLEFADIGRELTDAFRGLPWKHIDLMAIHSPERNRS
jgi:hypothetical protein